MLLSGLLLLFLSATNPPFAKQCLLRLHHLDPALVCGLPNELNSGKLLFGICGPLAFYGQVHHGRSVSEPLCLYLHNCYLTLAVSPASFAALIPTSDGAGSSDFQRSVDFNPFC